MKKTKTNILLIFEAYTMLSFLNNLFAVGINQKSLDISISENLIESDKWESQMYNQYIHCIFHYKKKDYDYDDLYEKITKTNFDEFKEHVIKANRIRINLRNCETNSCTSKSSIQMLYFKLPNVDTRTCLLKILQQLRRINATSEKTPKVLLDSYETLKRKEFCLMFHDIKGDVDFEHCVKILTELKDYDECKVVMVDGLLKDSNFTIVKDFESDLSPVVEKNLRARRRIFRGYGAEDIHSTNLVLFPDNLETNEQPPAYREKV